MGDRVLIRNLGLKGKQKLADRWSADPYVVESQLPGIPVYMLKPVDGDGPVKVMHQNHILPLGQEVFGDYNSSHAWWCNSNALCEICNSRPVLLPCSL